MTAQSNTEHLAGDDWAGEMGRRWLSNLDRFEAMIAPIGAALLAQADYCVGERVIDLGCGGAATSLAIARAVAPTGSVLGLDISPDLIARAHQRARDEGVANAHFLCADASLVSMDDVPFDRLHSRFGSMFFADPPAAFANLHRQLAPGARIDLAVWGPRAANEWMMAMMRVARQYVEVPPTPARAPGPFAFEEPDYLTQVLIGGGFRDVAIKAWEGMQAIGGPGLTVAEAADFAMSAMAIRRLMEDAGLDLAAAARADLENLFAVHHSDEGGVELPANVWLVSAYA